MTVVDFVITNPRHHLAMFGGVIEWLRRETDVQPRVVSLCELRGYETPHDTLTAMGAQPLQFLRVRLKKDARPYRVVRERVAGRWRAWSRGLVWRWLIRWQAHYHRVGWPAMTVVPNDSAFPYDRIMRVARHRGIPTVLVQEGIRYELAEEGGAYGRGGADAIAAWGPSSVRYFTGIGVPADRIHAVGNPRLDAIVGGEWSAHARALKADLRLGDDVVVFLSNPIERLGYCTTEEKYALFQRFLTMAGPFLESTEFQLVVKIHPAESLPRFRDIARTSAHAERILVVRDAELYPLLQAARAAVVVGSTAGLEALLFGLPLGVLAVPNAGFLYDFVAAGVGLPLRPDASLSDGLRRLVAANSTAEATRHAYLQDQAANLGHSALAVGRLLLSVLPQTVAGPVEMFTSPGRGAG